MTSENRVPATRSGPAGHVHANVASDDQGTPSRKAARVIGTLILAGWATYGPGSGITASVLQSTDYLAEIAANQMTFALGAVLMLLNSAAVVGIGVMWLPVLRRHSERIALSYLSTRILEAALCAVGVITLLSLMGVSVGYVSAGAAGLHFETVGALAISVNDLSYQIAMAALGAGSLFFCGLLYRTGLVPRPLAAWGFVGYAVFLAGMVLDILGFGVGLLLSIPGGAFELVFAVWLIAKGFATDPEAPLRLSAEEPVPVAVS